MSDIFGYDTTNIESALLGVLGQAATNKYVTPAQLEAQRIAARAQDGTQYYLGDVNSAHPANQGLGGYMLPLLLIGGGLLAFVLLKD